MKSVIRLAIVDPNDATRAALKQLLLSIDAVWLEAECSQYEVFADIALQTQPDIALIVLDSNPDVALEAVTQIAHQLPSCNALVVSSSQEGSLILKAMRNGAKEFLSYPLLLEDFLAALDRIQQNFSQRDGDGPTRSSQVITVCGVNGGVGCTSLAINVACVLAQNERNNVAIIDLDLALGDADVWLDIIPDYTIQDVAENINRLDYALLKRSLTKHDCGAFLLPRPVNMDARPSFSSEELRRVIALLKATFTHLVIDCSKSFSPLDIAAMEASDSILLTTQLDLPCLRNVVRLLQFFDGEDSLADKVKVIVNRLGLQDTQISLSKALETIGRDVFHQIPNDYGTMVESRNNGVPLLTYAPKAKVTREIEKLSLALDSNSSVVVGGSAGAEVKQKKRLFSFLGK
ncbi:MAG: AAA family ATPase [Planctomycetota bacterium]|nr:AAA family ATPase [Planctomycetota bacterium]